MKHKMGVAVFFALFLTTNTGYGREIIKGVIEDAEGQPVSGVEVSIAKLGYKTMTDRDGLFVIPCVEGYMAIDCSSADVPRWCGLKSRYRQTLTKDQCNQGWGAIRLKGILLVSEDDKKKWLFRSNTCQFIDNMDGTITDRQTGLMWAAVSPMDSMGIMSCWTWDEAKKYCDELDLAGHADWALPSLAQLESLPHHAIHGGPVDTAESWWSSDLAEEGKAWVLRRGRHITDESTNNNAVLAVRFVKN